MEGPEVRVVGMGFAGITSARALADAGVSVHLVDKRGHFGGNAFDELDANGVRIHRYGPHIFHTNSDRVLAFLSRFTDWRVYEHRVLSSVPSGLLPFPINRTTLNRLYGLDLDEAGAAALLERLRVPHENIVTSEQAILASIGHELCDLFYRGYTRKHWGLDLGQLAASVATRIPVRTSDDDRYFSDRHQCMPADGYTAMFERMLDHPRISWETGVAHSCAASARKELHLVYTGPIDAFYDFRHGRLPYRSLAFRHEHRPGVVRHQPVATINYPGAEPYTRITEFKHLTGQRHSGTSLAIEYPQDEGEPYYPVPTAQNEALYRRYKALAAASPDVTFVGRLAQYRYYNMDQVVAAALKAAQRVIERLSSVGQSRRRERPDPA